ncbi:aldo/keto reductase [Thermosporothrix hazakensis]|jgi:aryl-alcohol dehydrogenase-like predicted oxidoreductase|nr:aldo/keto reductase [Thermosporothrix hazakensis]
MGKAQLPYSKVGLGTWAIGGGWGPQPEEVSLATLVQALEAGCQLVDTAPLYGHGRAEELIARAFKLYGARVTVLTKVAPLAYQWAPAANIPVQTVFPAYHIVQQAEESLKRLATECLDCLLLQTWCPAWTEPGEWYEALVNLQRQGKIRSFGISVSDHRAYDAIGVIEAGLVDIVEVPYSILDQRAASTLFPIALKHGTSIIVRTPLASGALAGSWHKSMKFDRRDWRRRVFKGEHFERTVARVEKIKALLDPDAVLPQIALRFCLSHPAITAVIPGARTPEQVACNLATMRQDPLPTNLLKQIQILWKTEFCYNVRTSVGEEGEGERRLKEQEQEGQRG